MKRLTCKDVGVDCDVVFEADTEEKVMELAATHAAAEHNLPEIPPHIEEKCRASMQDVPEKSSDTAA